jgi:hypothetical protein
METDKLVSFEDSKMVRGLCFCLFFLASVPMSMAGLVTIDAMLPPPSFPTSPSFLNASGNPVNNVTRTLSSPSGGFGFSASGQVIFGGGGGQSGTLTYGFSTPLTLADFSTPANTNWLMELNVTSSNLNAYRVTGFVNGTSYGQLTGPIVSGTGIINASFLSAVSGDINSLSFLVENIGDPVLFETLQINSVSAVPEPASMLTAGAFSLVGGLMYRRRKAKKIEVLTA